MPGNIASAQAAPAAPPRRLALLVLAVFVVAGVSVVVLNNPGLVRFWPFSAGEFVQALTPLVLIALFIERALEVFISGWRGGGEKALGAAVKDGSAAAIDLVAYKSVSRRAAFTAAVLLGITISAIGVRALELFVDPAVFAALTSAQRTVFRVIDVVLTGAVLGGGADGMHKLVSVFTNFMDRTNANLKGGTP